MAKMKRQYNPDNLYDQLRQIIDLPKDGVMRLTLTLDAGKTPVVEIKRFAEENPKGMFPETVTEKFRVVPIDEGDECDGTQF